MKWPEIPDRDLIDLCLRGDEAAWREFLRRFQPIIVGVAYNTYRSRSRDHQRPDESALEDFLHAVLDKLLGNDMRALRFFNWTHDNAFRAFLKVTTSNLVADNIRKENSDKRDRSKEISLDPAMPLAARPEAVDVDSRILLGQIASCLEKHSDAYAERTRDIAIFLLYFGHKVTAMDLSKVYKLNVRLVENIIARLIRVARSKCLGRAAAES
jgi:RNA polymerase sigma factor (sigma-70 family)